MILWGSLIHCSSILAKDLGVQGHIYQIEEPDLLEYIYSTLGDMQSSGELSNLQEQWKRDFKKKVMRPKPVEGVVVTSEEKVFYFDPTIEVMDDIRDHRGALIHKAGTRLNPLNYVHLGQMLVFIDGDDEKQVEWALKIIPSEHEPKKIILVKGSPIELMRSTKVRIYFDQQGYLLRQLGITQVPAIAVQEGDKILVREKKL